MAGERNYHKVLEDHKKRLGDYEQVHFRKSFISERGRAQSILSLGSGSGSGVGITLAPRRSSKPLPELVPFTANSASLYLRQTENLWLCPNLTRHSAAKALFDRPTGAFIVRNSQKARYALSLRVPTNDPAVSHFLIQTNQQGFLTIQGSNLPFLSIYDLLAYFCFNKSGGMPCLLTKPEPDVEKQSMESSDSSDSEEEAKEPYRPRAYLTQHYSSASPPPSSPYPPSPYPTSPPPVPPHYVAGPSRRTPTPSISGQKSRNQTLSVGSDSYPVHEEIFIDSQKQSDYLRGMRERLREKSRSQSPHSHSPSPPPPRPPPHHHHRKRQPPPKPPRGPTLEETLENHDEVPSEEAQLVVRSVDGIVDMDAKKLYHNFQKIQLENGQAEGQRGGQPAEQASPSRHSSLQRKISLSSNDVRKAQHVNSLVEMFEHVWKNGPPSPSAVFSSSPSSNHFRQRFSHQVSVPSVPPRPSRPARPPRPTGSTSSHDEAPAIPPHTPAPLLPPKPLSSKAPYLLPRERASSDTTKSKPRPPAPPPGDTSPPILPPKTYFWPRSEEPHYEFDKELRAKLAAHKAKEAMTGEEGAGEGWVNLSSEQLTEGSMNGLVSSTSEQITESERDLQELSTSAAVEGGAKDKAKRKRAWPKKLPKFYRKPRKKIKKFIVDLSGDTSQEFGRTTTEFVSDMKSRSADPTQPYQRVLAEIRTFISDMHDHLLQHHHSELVNCGMESCNNFEHVVETSLQHCILQPLSHYVYLRIDEHFMEDGALFQVQRSVHQGKNKTPEEMGIREGLVVPSDKAISEIGAVFNRMIKTYCAISKLEYLLEAVRLTYENVRDSKNPKKSMSDLGADDFLPLFVWVLVQCGFTRAEIEAEYMWGLAHPSLFNGEAGYYLTTLTSAVNVLKETQHSPAIPLSVDLEEQVQQLPCMNNLQTELKVYFEDASTGQYSSAYRLPIVPTMTAAEVCEIIGEKHCKSNPQKYGLYTVVDGQATELGKEELPQEVKLKWALEPSTNKPSAPQRQPSKRFIAYRLRAPEHT